MMIAFVRRIIDIASLIAKAKKQGKNVSYSNSRALGSIFSKIRLKPIQISTR